MPLAAETTAKAAGDQSSGFAAETEIAANMCVADALAVFHVDVSESAKVKARDALEPPLPEIGNHSSIDLTFFGAARAVVVDLDSMDLGAADIVAAEQSAAEMHAPRERIRKVLLDYTHSEALPGCTGADILDDHQKLRQHSDARSGVAADDEVGSRDCAVVNPQMPAVNMLAHDEHHFAIHVVVGVERSCQQEDSGSLRVPEHSAKSQAQSLLVRRVPGLDEAAADGGYGVGPAAW